MIKLRFDYVSHSNYDRLDNGHIDMDALLNLFKAVEMEYQCKWGDIDKWINTNISTEDTHQLSFDDVWE